MDKLPSISNLRNQEEKYCYYCYWRRHWWYKSFIMNIPMWTFYLTLCFMDCMNWDDIERISLWGCGGSLCVESLELPKGRACIRLGLDTEWENRWHSLFSVFSFRFEDLFSISFLGVDIESDLFLMSSSSAFKLVSLDALYIKYNVIIQTIIGCK